MRWVQRDAKGAQADLESLGLQSAIEQLLANLGKKNAAEIERFLNPKLSDLDDPFRISHLKDAAKRIASALEEKEAIGVIGDYDVDGVTSTVLITSLLRELGAQVDYCVPRRMEEGYGLSPATVKRVLASNPPKLLLVLDCGTNSADEIRELEQRGISVIVVDHHQCKTTPPEEGILINPHVLDNEAEPWYHCCTVGLVFKLAHGLIKYLREKEHPVAQELKLKPYLDLVAMGTIADLVPLEGENRIFAWYGLKHIPQTKYAGLRALCEVSGLDLSHPVQSTDISFRLGPRINASGRIADAKLPVDMLLEQDFETCLESARQLEQLNKERQGIERQMIHDAQERIEASESLPSGFVIFDPNWHPGVVGIVAGKLSRELHRPCIVLGREGELAKGSCRSISGIDLVKVLASCGQYLNKWGGHPMAAGIELAVDQVDAFKDAFSKAIENEMKDGLPEPEISIDVWLSPDELSYKLLEELDRLSPFGQANPQPIFGIKNIRLTREVKAFGKGHFRFEFPSDSGSPMRGIAWNQAHSLPPARQSIDLAIRLAWNHWNGKRYPQAELQAWRHSS